MACAPVKECLFELKLLLKGETIMKAIVETGNYYVKQCMKWNSLCVGIICVLL